MKKFNFPKNYFDEGDIRKDTIDKPVLILEIIRHNEYGKFHIRPAYSSVSKTGEDIVEFYRDYDGQHILCSLTVMAQFGWDDKHLGVYAENISYASEEAMSIRHFERAEEKFKFLKSLNKTLNTISNTRGYTNSFGEYVQRFAEALGVEYFVITKERSYPFVVTRRIHVSDINRIVNKAFETNEIGY